VTLTVEESRDLVRDYVGSVPADDDVDAAVARFAAETDPEKRAALSILRRRYADIVAGPGKVDVKDDVSWESRPDQMAALAAKIRRLEADLGEVASDLPSLTSAPICGPGNAR
jgi:hypothetical protein